MRATLMALLAAGLAFAAAVPVVVAGELGEAVIKRLGPVEPTPVPSPEAEERIRLISSFSMQNKPDGKSIITFEATDYGEGENDTFRTIAIEQYSLLAPKQAARGLRDQIVRKLRDLERDLLEFVEITGPPRAPDPLGSQGTR